MKKLRFCILSFIVIIIFSNTVFANPYELSAPFQDAFIFCGDTIYFNKKDLRGSYNYRSIDHAEMSIKEENFHVGVLINYHKEALLLATLKKSKNKWELYNSSIKALPQNKLNKNIRINNLPDIIPTEYSWNIAIDTKNIWNLGVDNYLYLNKNGESYFVGALLNNKKIKIYRNDDAYVFEADDKSTNWSTYLMPLETFNAKLLPKNIDEVNILNKQYERLYHLAFSYNNREKTQKLNNIKNTTAPLYSYPDTKSYRPGKGKAAIGLKGDFWVIAKDGDYYLVKYFATSNIQRVGYIKAEYLDGFVETTTDIKDCETVEHKMNVKGYITMDPDVSQNKEFTIKKGETVNIIGLYDPFYAYVECKIKNKKIRGFMPLVQLK